MKYTEALQLHKTASDMKHGPNFDWKHTLKWTGIAGLPGFVGSTVYNLLQGKPYTEADRRMPKGKDVYIGVTGGHSGRGSGAHKNFINTYGKQNVAMFRWSDRPALRRFIARASAQGKTIHGIGHSYGASTLVNQLKNSKLPVASLTTYDPVSWTQRVYKKPSNVSKWVNYIPDNGSKKNLNDWIATVGGAWGNKVQGSKVVPGTDHGFRMGAHPVTVASNKSTSESAVKL